MVVNFKFDLTGYKCNSYPTLTILHNQDIVFHGPIENNVIVDELTMSELEQVKQELENLKKVNQEKEIALEPSIS